MVHRVDPICAGDQEFAGDIGLSGDELRWCGPAGMASAGWLVDRGGVHGRHDDGRGSSNPSSNPSSLEEIREIFDGLQSTRSGGCGSESWEEPLLRGFITFIMRGS
jgi:hypothetical protein